MSKDLDSGEIVLQERIPYSICETGGSLYEKTTALASKLIESNWENFLNNSIGSFSQVGKSTSHAIADFSELTNLHPFHRGTLLEHLNMIRARKFSEIDCARVTIDEKTYSINITITEA
jgi:methionyl-tRNA formyltransferase